MLIQLTRQFFGWLISNFKSILECLSFVATAVAAMFAARTYSGNAQRERAKWAVQLYEKFYEGEHYKRVRSLLDSEADSEEVKGVVKMEGDDFTDYLNFFELVIFLTESKQLKRSDVLTLFKYYLDCLKKHKTVMSYLNDEEKGFEQLSGFLAKLEP